VSLTEIDHIVLLVRDIDEAIQTWERLGFKLSYRVHLGDVGLTQAFFMLVDGTFIELIAPTVQDNIYAEMLREKGEGLRLLSFRVDDLDEAVADLLQKGVTLRGVGTPRVFVEPESASGMLIQLWPKDRPHRWRDTLEQTA
jgi:methylmalonyl-CoA/ethylmalonyl-CoA epimerase